MPKFSNDFVRGFSSIFNLFPNDADRVNVEIPRETDIEAIEKDWEQVGKDMYEAINLL